MNKQVSRIENVPIRDVFKSEPQHFTPWLEGNIEALQGRLGLGQLTVVQREQSVGDFKVDLVCEDSDGHLVIIENQLEQTNHDHLGKLLTYLVNHGANTAIWISTEPRQEHVRVIDWLNESTPADIAFYLVKVEAIKIGDSPSAPLFTILVAPDAQTKEIGKSKKEWASRHYNRLEFWTELLERSKDKTKLFSNVTPGRYSWLGIGAGKSGVTFNYVVWTDDSGIELYIDHDKETGEGNKLIFDKLHSQKAEIEKELGVELEWSRLAEKRSSRIRKRFDSGGMENPETWPTLHGKMIEMMIRFEGAIRPRLARIQID